MFTKVRIRLTQKKSVRYALNKFRTEEKRYIYIFIYFSSKRRFSITVKVTLLLDFIFPTLISLPRPRIPDVVFSPSHRSRHIQKKKIEKKSQKRKEKRPLVCLFVCLFADAGRSMGKNQRIFRLRLDRTVAASQLEHNKNLTFFFSANAIFLQPE